MRRIQPLSDSLDFTPWLLEINPSQPKIAISCQTLENDLYAQIVAETRPCLIKRARKALQAIPDASCDSIAAALGLSPHTVRALSKGNRLGREYYPPQEILDALNQ